MRPEDLTGPGTCEVFKGHFCYLWDIDKNKVWLSGKSTY